MFGLSTTEARRQAAQVATVCSGWKQHFARSGVSAADIEYVARFVDRDFPKDQRPEQAVESDRRRKPGARKR